MSDRVRKVQVLRHPNGRSPNWYLRWWELKADGKTWKERWKTTGTPIKRKAEDQRRKLERELQDGPPRDGSFRWDDFVESFLEKHANRKAPQTRELYEKSLKSFQNVVRPPRTASVTLGMLEDFVAARLKDGASPNTVNKELRHVKVALRWAWKREFISRVPDFGSVFLRVERKQPVVIPEGDFVAMVQALTRPELQLAFRSASWWKVFIYLAYYAGLRRGEILGLCWEHVRFDALEMVVSATTSKGRKDRVVPFNQELGAILLQWRASQPTIPMADEVLPWEKDSLRQLYDDWHAIQKAAGIPDGQHYVPKNCRSSCASALIAAGAPTVVVKDILGHATVATTETFYINTTPALRSAITARKVKIV